MFFIPKRENVRVTFKNQNLYSIYVCVQGYGQGVDWDGQGEVLTKIEEQGYVCWGVPEDYSANMCQ